ncbi:hypothetical protein, partial [Arthrobacter sp. M4]|uniref:hypothetical protein n=1 Tax=Arthrobacter sp. M4 TaxID=218160 RepID=UPI001CDC329D
AALILAGNVSAALILAGNVSAALILAGNVSAALILSAALGAAGWEGDWRLWVMGMFDGGHRGRRSCRHAVRAGDDVHAENSGDHGHHQDSQACGAEQAMKGSS